MKDFLLKNGTVNGRNIKKDYGELWKLHRLKMIDSILREMYFYVHNVVGRVEDEFDDCEEFEEYITESIIKNTKENIATLSKYTVVK